jgi:hypothetical protein
VGRGRQSHFLLVPPASEGRIRARRSGLFAGSSVKAPPSGRGARSFSSIADEDQPHAVGQDYRAAETVVAERGRVECERPGKGGCSRSRRRAAPAVLRCWKAVAWGGVGSMQILCRFRAGRIWSSVWSLGSGADTGSSVWRGGSCRRGGVARELDSLKGRQPSGDATGAAASGASGPGRDGCRGAVVMSGVSSTSAGVAARR